MKKGAWRRDTYPSKRSDKNKLFMSMPINAKHQGYTEANNSKYSPVPWQEGTRQEEGR